MPRAHRLNRLALVAALLLGAPGAAPGYVVPLPRPVELARGFEPPAVRWGPGHRGVDLAAPEGASVLAPGDGLVHFVGRVADRTVVVVRHPDGRLSSLEPLEPSVVAGQEVRAGQELGRLAAGPSHCAPRPCLHWGVRGPDYLDPLALLRRAPVVLLPLSAPPR